MKRNRTIEAEAKALVRRYRGVSSALERFKSMHFYHGTSVKVNCARYKGPGISVTDGECWPDHVAVSLPNGNTWRYPIEAVTPGRGVRIKRGG